VIRKIKPVKFWMEELDVWYSSGITHSMNLVITIKVAVQYFFGLVKLLIILNFFILVSNDDPSLNVKQNSNGNFKIQRRSFYLRLIKKVVSRDEQPELELVHVMGTLMVQNSGTKSNIIAVLFKKKV
jgi:hypothetical protein